MPAPPGRLSSGGGIRWGRGASTASRSPARVIEGMRKLKPRLVRIFLQEYFNVYPAHGVFDWGKLDAYMDSCPNRRQSPGND